MKSRKAVAIIATIALMSACGTAGWVSDGTVQEGSSMNLLSSGSGAERDEISNKVNTNTRLYGDVDYDGNISSSDALFILRYSVGLDSPSDVDKLLSDVDADGRVSSQDALATLRYSVGLKGSSIVGTVFDVADSSDVEVPVLYDGIIYDKPEGDHFMNYTGQSSYLRCLLNIVGRTNTDGATLSKDMTTWEYDYIPDYKDKTLSNTRVDAVSFNTSIDRDFLNPDYDSMTDSDFNLNDTRLENCLVPYKRVSGVGFTAEACKQIEDQLIAYVKSKGLLYDSTLSMDHSDIWWSNPCSMEKRYPTGGFTKVMAMNLREDCLGYLDFCIDAHNCYCRYQTGDENFTVLPSELAFNIQIVEDKVGQQITGTGEREFSLVVMFGYLIDNDHYCTGSLEDYSEDSWYNDHMEVFY